MDDENSLALKKAIATIRHATAEDLLNVSYKLARLVVQDRTEGDYPDKQHEQAALVLLGRCIDHEKNNPLEKMNISMAIN